MLPLEKPARMKTFMCIVETIQYVFNCFYEAILPFYGTADLRKFSAVDLVYTDLSERRRGVL